MSSITLKYVTQEFIQFVTCLFANVLRTFCTIFTANLDTFDWKLFEVCEVSIWTRFIRQSYHCIVYQFGHESAKLLHIVARVVLAMCLGKFTADLGIGHTRSFIPHGAMQTLLCKTKLHDLTQFPLIGIRNY